MNELIWEFPRYLSHFDAAQPFRKAGQLQLHVKTIQLRRALGSVQRALRDASFLVALYETIQAWGIGGRRSRLVPLKGFCSRLISRVDDMVALEPLQVGSAGLDGTFFDLADLNRAIGEELELLNNRPFQKLPGSPRTAYETLDRPALKSAPTG